MSSVAHENLPLGCRFCDVILAYEGARCPRWDCRRERVPVARDERAATERLHSGDAPLIRNHRSSVVIGDTVVPDTGNVDVHSKEWNAHDNDHWNAHSSGGGDIGTRIIPTQETYVQLQRSYDYLNRYLFETILPNCLITLQRRSRTYGYYAAGRFSRKDGRRTDEIALNPQHFQEGTQEILSTLAHEMVHLWQHHFGKPTRGGYHNRQWADKMVSIGLHPSDTGKEGGKQTGDAVSHYIVADGVFAQAVAELLASGFEIPWAEAIAIRTVTGDPVSPGGKSKPSRSGKRVKYSCPHGDLNAWAKAGAELLCGRHLAKMAPSGGGGQ